jgi:anti-sigma B factor antagonist
MNVTKSASAKDVTLTIEGRLDTMTSDRLMAEIEKVFQESFERLILDFHGVEYVSSAGLRVMITTQKKMTSLGRQLELHNMNDHVKGVFDITGFSKMMKINP